MLDFFPVNCQHQLKNTVPYCTIFNRVHFLCTFWLDAFSFNFLYCHFIFNVCVYTVKPQFWNKILSLQLDFNRENSLVMASAPMHG